LPPVRVGDRVSEGMLISICMSFYILSLFSIQTGSRPLILTELPCFPKAEVRRLSSRIWAVNST
jgi:hypothetical protein